MGKKRQSLVTLRFLLTTTFLGQMIAAAVAITIPIYADLLEASPFLIGLVGAAGGLVYTFMPLVGGILYDRLSRKALVCISMISYGSSCILYIFARDPFDLLFIKILEWTAIAVFWPTVEALLADTSDGVLEETLKKFNISWGSAMMIGPMVGGTLISVYAIKAPFLLSAVVSFSIAAFGVVSVKEPRRALKTDTHIVSEEGSKIINRSSTLTSLSSVLLFSSIGGIILALFPAYAIKLEIPPYEIGSIMLVFGASRTVAFYLANGIERRITKLGMYLGSSLVFASASALTVGSSTTLAFIVCFFFFGFGEGVSYAVSISFIFRNWGFSRGYAAGLFESLIGIGYFLGPLIGGALSEYALNAPYQYTSMLSLAVFTLQLALNRSVLFNHNRKSQELIP